jgi:malate dehydrogenase (quinone)
MNQASAADTDIILVGAGIMSATLAVFLKELDPSLRIEIFETLEGAALESSDAWNNAGTGHAALCELNYTPQRSDGSIDISKALEVNTEFDLSRQFWSYLIRKKALASPDLFIHAVPHMSFVHGAAHVAYLKKRYAALTAHQLYRGMEFTEDKKTLRDWIPLVMEGRPEGDTVAATRMITGADVNYGALTRNLIAYLQTLSGFAVHYSRRVTGLRRVDGGRWRVDAVDTTNNAQTSLTGKFVFLGGGGGALPLLQKSGIPEARGYAGFPVSGIWLRCDDPAINKRHHAKVYGMADVGSPPMSVPHLDTRVIGTNHSILFGPYAGFSTKFLKRGSWLDLFASIRLDNILPMMEVGLHNFNLDEYLVDQVVQSPKERFSTLTFYYPQAQRKDWRMQHAGMRVQIIKRDPARGGILKFGTEIVAAQDRSLVALLGASPGASTAAAIMIKVLELCFGKELASGGWKGKLEEIIRSYGHSLIDDAALTKKVRDDTAAVLWLQTV